MAILKCELNATNTIQQNMWSLSIKTEMFVLIHSAVHSKHMITMGTVFGLLCFCFAMLPILSRYVLNLCHILLNLCEQKCHILWAENCTPKYGKWGPIWSFKIQQKDAHCMGCVLSFAGLLQNIIRDKSLYEPSMHYIYVISITGITDKSVRPLCIALFINCFKLDLRFFYIKSMNHTRS